MSHLGPVRILIAFSTPPANFNGNNWQPGVFYVYDETIREAMEADPACVLSEFGVDGYSLAASHITIQAFEGVSATTTFEF